MINFIKKETMIESVLIITGMILFLSALFDKLNIWEVLERYSMKVKYKWIYKLLNCSFCFMFHSGVILTLIYGVVSGFFWGLLIVPFVVSGLTYKRINK